MAAKKATTTKDLTGIDEAAAPPTREELVAAIEEATSPEMVADVEDVEYVTVTAPSGHKTRVPAELVARLEASGYSASKSK